MNATTPLGRRSFVIGALALTTAGAAGAGLMTSPRRVAAQTATTTAWVLKTDGWSVPRGNPLRTHCKCSACVAHATNKIFATLAAASDPSHRAHPGCLCEPSEIELPTVTWTALFASASIVDRRTLLVTAPVSGQPADALDFAGATTQTAGLQPARPQPLMVASSSDAAAPAVPLDVGAQTAPGPLPSASPGSPTSAAAPRAAAARANAPHGQSAAPAWETIGLPSAGLALGLGFLLWWRRRNDEEEPGSTSA